MMQHFIDGTGYTDADAAVAVLITMSALLTYGRVAFELAPSLKLPVPRLMMAVGWSIWAVRFWYALAIGVDVVLAPISMVAIGLITSGYCVVQLRAIRTSMALARTPLRCFREPDMSCQREDRVQELFRK